MFRNCIVTGFVLAVVLLPGCSSYNGDEIRKDHAENFPQQLADKSAQVLADYTVLDLNDCIELAMEHSLEVRSVDIQQRVAKLNKQVSFANFLPAVQLGVDHTWFDPNPQVRLTGGPGVTMHDSYFRNVTWNFELALFNPATWNLYAMHARGYEIAELVNRYTRQAIALQVTSFYFQVLSLEKIVQTAEVYLTAAENLNRELQAMQGEGLVPTWQAEQGRLLVLQRQSQLRQYKRSQGQIRSELLVAMGLSPQRDIRLKMDLPLTLPAGTLADAMAEALLSHPSLAIADRQVAIDHEKVKLAFASFLPQIMGFAQHLNTSDSQQVFANQWMGGIGGVMTVFNGFANINQYKAAKQEREDAFIQREQATLTLMIQVIRAWDQVQTAREQVAVTQLAGRVADAHLNELRQQQAQGLVQPSDLLSLVAENDQVHAQYLLAQVQYQTSVAMLLNVMGQTQIEFEEPSNDGK